MDKFMNKKNIIIISIVVVAIVLATVVTLALKDKGGKISDNTDTENAYKTEVKEKLSKLKTKSIVIVLGEELSTDINDYVEEIPVSMDLSKFVINTSSVDVNSVGTYSYTISYDGVEASGLVTVIETEEEREELMQRIKEQQEYIDQKNKEAEENGQVLENTNENEIETGSQDNNQTSNNQSSNNQTSNNNSSNNNSNNGNNNNNNNNSNNTSQGNVAPEEPEEEVPKKELSGTATKTPDYTITKYGYAINPKTESIIPVMPNYNGQLYYVMERPIVPDIYGEVAFRNFRNTHQGKQEIEDALQVAKNTFGEDKPYCVQYTEWILAKNKDDDVVGVIVKAVIATKDETDSCSVNEQTIYLNNRIKLRQNDDTARLE